MKYLPLLLLTLLLAACSGPKYTISRQAVTQARFFPKELALRGIYFGMPKTEFLEAFEEGRPVEEQFDFREVYLLENLSDRFPAVSFYLDAEGTFPFYECILITNDEQDAIARELFGEPNHGGEEWRFFPSQTGLGYTVAAWTFQNKLVIAAGLEGTEWETGFD